eukprot:COSAG01_NODE_244_length_20489_cov_21.366748_4_plen_444_part_00
MSKTLNRFLCKFSLTPMHHMHLLCKISLASCTIRYGPSGIVTLGSQMLMPAVAFFNNTNSTSLHTESELKSRAEAVCKLHKSSLVLIVSDVKDGLHWSYVTTIASASDLPATKEGPNEVAMMFLEEAGPRGTLVVIFRSDELHYYRADSIDHGRTWSAPFMLRTRSNDPSAPPLGAVQPVLASLHLSNQPGNTVVRVLKGGRPGLFVWSSVDLHSRNWTESNIGAIHNDLVTSASYKFAPDFVAGKQGHQPQANPLQNHASNMVQLDSSSFLLYYDRSWWSRIPPANDPDMLFSMVARLQKCSNANDALGMRRSYGQMKLDDDVLLSASEAQANDAGTASKFKVATGPPCSSVGVTCSIGRGAIPDSALGLTEVVWVGPEKNGMYVGSPSIVQFANGTVLASHDFFGPLGTLNATVQVLRDDTGLVTSGSRWVYAGNVSGMYW